MVSLTVLLALLGVMFGLGRLGPGAVSAAVSASSPANPAALARSERAVASQGACGSAPAISRSQRRTASA